MSGKKPNEFPLRNQLDGSEELYTQTNGFNEKFTVGQIWTGGTIDYSFTEQKTGRKWINGKDVYEIVLEMDGFDPEIVHGLNIEFYLNIRLLNGDINGNNFGNISTVMVAGVNYTSPEGGSRDDFFISFIDANTIEFADVYFDDESLTVKYVILEYTKNS